MRCAAVLTLASVGVTHADRGFADRVLDYTPAPGQFINANNSQGFAFNNPIAALGAPIGGGTVAADNSKLVTLGGFGGSITLGFPTTVLDDPRNPYGVDAIVFGNALYVANNPTRRFAEPATIEISLDVNNNNIPDDPWFLIAPPPVPLPTQPFTRDSLRPPPTAATKPSLLFPPSPASALRSQAWDNTTATSTPPVELSWYPTPAVLPTAGDSYTTSAFELSAALAQTVVAHSQGPSAQIEEHLGLADFTPTLALGDTNADNIVDNPNALTFDFYTTPDNPFRVGITPGSGGGDAFDIAWAVDPQTGDAANLPGFDFIRITTAVDVIVPLFSEKSTELSGVADVAPNLEFFDVNNDSLVNIEDLYAFSQRQGSRDIDQDTRVATLRDYYLLLYAVRRAELGFK